MKAKTKLFNVFRNFLRLPFAERLLRKFSIGRDTQSLVSRLVPNNYQYPVGSMRNFEYKGVNLSLDIHDYVSHYLYFGFKDRSHEVLMNLVRSGDTILDIGTNYGTTILQFGKLIGSSGRAYGFEPDPVNFSICSENLSRNNLSNVSVENIGLGRKMGEVALVVDTESNRGCNRIGVPSTDKEWHKVVIWNLDEWIEDRKVGKVDLIKIDVEGYEMEVLSGATRLLNEFAPTLFVELDDSNLGQQGSSAKELVQFLEKHRFAITHAESGSIITSENDFSSCHFDIICKRKPSR